ncbi:ABC transporter substrate-binding protein [Actinomyces howellii]|uniref:ABC transporter substrate-binding protein yesO n=1 Tax=Actinomyces howellii TaxID=52771 RepID=A0A3S4SNZ2_9ACTO|nr:sugar ABC transporter substrate-binding protein [Actinomyces howellii]VEG29440.1 Putative ABC transporter substrate-binding protein yesO [Actinomyces howellii]
MLMRRREFGRMAALMTALAAAGVAGCSGGGGESDGEVTLEFTQWWEPELPDGTFRALMDTFEEQNPGIKVELLSGPYASTKEQLVAGAAAQTMPDVVGLDGAWVSDFAKQGAIADLTALMSEQGYDDSELASQIQVDGATYMIPVVNFVYPLFANMGLLEGAGVTAMPSTREEFKAAATAVAATGGDVSGWALPLSLEAPNGIQNDVMSWVWASGGSMLKDGKPYLEGNSEVKSVCEFIKGLWDEGVVSPGAFTMKEQDKVEDFTNGRVGLMIDSLAHVNTIREGNPELTFDIAAIPAVEGYTGERGMPYASWGIGVSASTEHPAEAWKLVEFLMSADINSSLANDAKAFPGNSTATPDYVTEDEVFAKAFEIWSSGTPANEFTGLPVSETLMRDFDEQFQTYLSGGADVDTMLSKAQDAWDEKF